MYKISQGSYSSLRNGTTHFLFSCGNVAYFSIERGPFLTLKFSSSKIYALCSNDWAIIKPG